MSSHVSDRLSPFADGELTPEEHGEVEAHLRDCVECARELASLVEVDAMARDLPLSAPDGYFDSFPTRVRERLKARPASRTWQHWTWAAAAALLLAVVTPLTLKEKRAQPLPPVEAPATTPGPTVMGEVAQQSVPAMKPLPDTTAPRDDGVADKLRVRREAERPAVPEVETAAREKQKEQSSEAKLAAAPAPPAMSAPRPVAPAATPAPRANEGFAAPPAESGAGDAPPPGDERLRKTGAPPTPRGNEQRGPRAQAQVPSSTQEPQGGFSQATEKQKPRRESGRLAAGEEKRHTDQAAVEATKKAEEGVEKDGEKKDTDAKGTLGYSASRTAQLSDDALYRSLAARPAGTPADARELREAWRGFLKAHPQSPWADQVRVRIIEASLAAWRLGGDAADLESLRRDRDAYLRRADAAQKERVRALLPESGR